VSAYWLKARYFKLYLRSHGRAAGGVWRRWLCGCCGRPPLGPSVAVGGAAFKDAARRFAVAFGPP